MRASSRIAAGDLGAVLRFEQVDALAMCCDLSGRDYRQSDHRGAEGGDTVFAANQPAPVMDVSAADLHGARETKCTPSRPSSEKPSAAPDETAIRKRGVPQRWYWSESI